jgi:hypothetical protein
VQGCHGHPEVLADTEFQTIGGRELVKAKKSRHTSMEALGIGLPGPANPILSGEGILKPLDQRFKSFPLTLLLLHEQGFNLASSSLNAIEPHRDSVDILLVGHSFVDERSQALNGCYVLFHISGYSRIINKIRSAEN